MSDRQQDSTLTIYADLPAVGLSGNVTLTDALGASAAIDTAYSEVGLKRYKCTLTVTTANTVHGLWKAVWSYAGGSLTQYFTVGDDTGSSKWDVRFQAARRVMNDTWFGVVTGSTTTTIVDDTLLGSDDEYVGNWVVLDSDEDQFGIYRRVTAYNSTTHTLTLSSAYTTAPTVGSRYLMLTTDMRPDRVDAALTDTYNNLVSRAYVKTQLTGQVPDSNGFLAIPDGWSHVTEVWYADTDNIEHHLLPTDWACVPGQRIYVPGFSTSWVVVIHGMRHARVPNWDDSSLDIPNSVLTTAMAQILHLDMAGGQATDFEAHSQQANQAFQEHGVQLTISLPRVPNNAKRVIP